MKSSLFSIIGIFLFLIPICQTGHTNPLRIGVAGLSHDHAHWVFQAEHQDDISIAGIAEPNRQLAERYARQYGFSMDIVYDSLEEMIDKTQPEAITAFGSIYDHLKVVQVSAPKGIHVMVEKPLAVNLDDAREMVRLAREHNIHLLTNYETTWYATNHAIYQKAIDHDQLGTLRKIEVYDGHEGPVEIGCSSEFLAWLTDPVLNGGGAIIDFGCYGANLATWLMKNEKPNAVWGITHQFKPDIYPKVDDEATIILEYPETQVVIQASWNWPFSRKDMKVYGEKGYLYAADSRNLESRFTGGSGTQTMDSRPAPFDNPFRYLAAVVREEIDMDPLDLSSPENNLIVMEILDAARKSAKSGKKITLNP